MSDQLTTTAGLPMGGGHASKPKAERGEAPKKAAPPPAAKSQPSSQPWWELVYGPLDANTED